MFTNVWHCACYVHKQQFAFAYVCLPFKISAKYQDIVESVAENLLIYYLFKILGRHGSYSLIEYLPYICIPFYFKNTEI